MYQAMPARCAPPSGLSAVSSAPHSLPLAYITCCMRVSFESGREMTSSCAGSADEQQPPAADAGDGRRRRVVDAVALRHVRRRRRARAGLLLLRRDRVLPDRQHLVAQVERGRGRVQRRGVRQRPDDEVGRSSSPAGADRAGVALRLVAGVRAQEVLGAAVVQVELSSCPATAPARR